MEQLSASQTFRRILATVLAIGNFLNGCKVSVMWSQSFWSICIAFLCVNESHGTFDYTKARGFELSYLGKLSQVRDTHTRQPLLHHVCVLLMQLYPQSSDLYSDITAVTKAGKVCSCASVCVCVCVCLSPVGVRDYFDITKAHFHAQVWRESKPSEKWHKHKCNPFSKRQQIVFIHFKCIKETIHCESTTKILSLSHLCSATTP